MLPARLVGGFPGRRIDTEIQGQPAVYYPRERELESPVRPLGVGPPKRFNYAIAGTMKYLLIAAMSYIAVGLLVEVPALAQKPDGQASAKKGVCVSLQIQKPGPTKMRDADPAMPCVEARSPSRDEFGFNSAAPKPARIHRTLSSHATASHPPQ